MSLQIEDIEYNIEDHNTLTTSAYIKIQYVYL